ncbi:hypothetical protein AB0F18_28625 [Streptomyces sp. NPDC029216]|uniref:hypothetical protein n=1 Tax=Streptomyces sp. NPDC029216 TaxID=3154701 RepID=UPI0033C487E5
MTIDEWPEDLLVELPWQQPRTHQAYRVVVVPIEFRKVDLATALAPSSRVSGETPHAPEPLCGSCEDHGLITRFDRSTDGITGHSRCDNAPCEAGAETAAHVCAGRRYCPPFQRHGASGSGAFGRSLPVRSGPGAPTALRLAPRAGRQDPAVADRRLAFSA